MQESPRYTVKLTIAGLQSAGIPGCIKANLAELEDAARTAAQAGADLLITPELFLTGYDIGDQIFEFCESDLLLSVRRIASKHGIALIAGAPEKASGTRACYNTAFFIDASGELLGRHRKAHLFGDLDRDRFVAGDETYTIVDFGGVRVAMMICYDVEFPEAVRAAALDGAHLIAVPTAQMAPFEFVAEQLVRVRAWENQVYVAYVNHDGAESDTIYVGRSAIIAPDATVLASVGSGNSLLYATVDTDFVAAEQRRNPYLLDRRPNLYRALTGLD